MEAVTEQIGNREMGYSQEGQSQLLFGHRVLDQTQVGKE